MIQRVLLLGLTVVLTADSSKTELRFKSYGRLKFDRQKPHFCQNSRNFAVFSKLWDCENFRIAKLLIARLWFAKLWFAKLRFAKLWIAKLWFAKLLNFETSDCETWIAKLCDCETSGLRNSVICETEGILKLLVVCETSVFLEK
jgi:hypothetical protein